MRSSGEGGAGGGDVTNHGRADRVDPAQSQDEQVEPTAGSADEPVGSSATGEAAEVVVPAEEAEQDDERGGSEPPAEAGPVEVEPRAKPERPRRVAGARPRRPGED